jgi:hypothetical protein
MIRISHHQERDEESNFTSCHCCLPFLLEVDGAALYKNK